MSIERVAGPEAEDAAGRLALLLVMLNDRLLDVTRPSEAQEPAKIALVRESESMNRVVAVWEGYDFLADLRAVLASFVQRRQSEPQPEPSGELASQPDASMLRALGQRTDIFGVHVWGYTFESRALVGGADLDAFVHLMKWLEERRLVASLHTGNSADHRVILHTLYAKIELKGAK